jgi:hypothetical protein
LALAGLSSVLACSTPVTTLITARSCSGSLQSRVPTAVGKVGSLPDEAARREAAPYRHGLHGLIRTHWTFSGEARSAALTGSPGRRTIRPLGPRLTCFHSIIQSAVAAPWMGSLTNPVGSTTEAARYHLPGSGSCGFRGFCVCGTGSNPGMSDEGPIQHVKQTEGRHRIHRVHRSHRDRPRGPSSSTASVSVSWSIPTSPPMAVRPGISHRAAKG